MSDQVCCDFNDIFNFLPFFPIAKSVSILSINNLFIKYNYHPALFPVSVSKIAKDLFVDEVSKACISKQVVKLLKQNIKSKKEVLKCHIP